MITLYDRLLPALTFLARPNSSSLDHNKTGNCLQCPCLSFYGHVVPVSSNHRIELDSTFEAIPLLHHEYSVDSEGRVCSTHSAGVVRA